MKCIFCPEEITAETKSKEDLPPKYLGGFLKLPFVCKVCNNTFGYTIEGELGKNAFIVTALDRLGLKKDKKELYRHADLYLEHPEDKKLKADLDGSGKPKVRPQIFNDSSVIMSDEDALNSLKKTIERREKKTGRKIHFDPLLFKQAKPGEIISIP